MRKNSTIRHTAAYRPSASPFSRRTHAIAVAAFALACLALLVAGCACLRIGAAYAQASVEPAAGEGAVSSAASPDALDGGVAGVSTICLSVPAILQNPELPTGCEATALASALAFFGFDVDKTEIADEWLARSDEDFVHAFLGDPHSDKGHTCMAPALVQAANDYLAAQASPLSARDCTGTPFSEVLELVAQGTPVIVWTTIGLAEPGEPYLMQTEGGVTYELFAASHCLVLSGFDAAAGTVYASDPLEGAVAYDAELLALRYQQLGSQAVAIS